MKTDTNKHIRIGNIEYLHDPDFKNNLSYEHSILHWFSNKYFGKLKEYLENGYVEKYDFLVKDNCRIDKNLFRSPELNCVIAHLEFSHSVDGYDIVSVGRRILDLDKTDFNNLHRVINIFDEDIHSHGQTDL